MTEWPTVSVILSTYKRANLLRRQLDSLLAQTYADFEVIIVHDGPAEEDTHVVRKEFETKFADRRILMTTWACGDEPSGYYCGPCNMGLGRARGDYLLFVDDDNEVTPEALTKMVAAMEEGTVWPDGVYGRRRYVKDAGTVSKEELSEGDTELVKWGPEAIQRLGSSVYNNFIDKGDLMVTRGAMWMLQYRTGGAWNESIRRFGDYECFVRGVFLAGWRLKEIDEIVNIYHWHGQNLQLTRSPNESPTGVEITTGTEVK